MSGTDDQDGTNQDPGPDAGDRAAGVTRLPLGLPKPAEADAPPPSIERKPKSARAGRPKGTRASPSVARLNEMVVSALGGVQRDWVRALHHARPIGAGDLTLAERTAERIDHVELRRQINLEAILQRALRILPDHVDDGAPDPDWAARFVTAASDTADLPLARLWSRLLVMEVKRPGAVPPIALARLPGLSREGLQLFRRFAVFAINNFVVRLDQEFFDGKDVSGDQILLLEEYGLIRTNRDLNRVFHSQRETQFVTNLLYADKALRISHDDPAKSLNLPCYRLTEFGTTLARAMLEEGELQSDTDYIVEIVRMVQRQGFQTAQADILERSDEQIVSKHSRFCELAVLNR